MSLSTISYVSNSLNNSISKEAHIFPKADRFLRAKRIQTEIKYSLPSTLQKKTCGFGYGEKAKMALNRCSPPPGTYESSSQFNNKPILPRTPSFSKGRDAILFGSYLKQAQILSAEIPSPNKYQIRLPRKTLGGRIGQRLLTEPQLKESKLIPGPGTYQLKGTEMSNNLSYVLSTFKKHSPPRYHQERTIDVCRSDSKSQFCICLAQLDEVMDRQFGRSRVSKFKNVSASRFGTAKRQGLFDKYKLEVPGFKYAIFSEFGQVKQ